MSRQPRWIIYELTNTRPAHLQNMIWFQTVVGICWLEKRRRFPIASRGKRKEKDETIDEKNRWKEQRDSKVRADLIDTESIENNWLYY